MREIIRVMGPMKLRELTSCMSAALSTEIDDRRTKQLLRICDGLNLVAEAPYGNDTYYFSVADSPMITLKYKDGAKINDTNRWHLLFKEKLLEIAPRRIKAVTAAREIASKTGVVT